MQRTLVSLLVLMVFAAAPLVGRSQSTPSGFQARVGLIHGSLSLATQPGGGAFALGLRPSSTGPEQGSLALTIGSAALLGTLGGIVGGLVGGTLSDGCDGFLCELEGVAFGILIAAPLGTAAGAHLGNGHRGSFGYDYLGAVAGFGVAIAIWSADSEGALMFLLGAVPAIAAPVLVERHSARAKARRRIEAIGLAPTPNGLAFALRLSLN